MGDILHLLRGDVELLCKDSPVARRLIEHEDKIRVFKDILHFAGSKQILDVLRNGCGYAAPFSETLPDFNGIGGGLFLFQEKMKFVHKIPGGFPFCPVDGDAVPYLVLHNEHEETYSGLTLDDERIRQAIIEFRPRLVVIDPIQAYLGSDSDLQIAGRARKLMQRLGMWASVYDCAIVLIGHLNKKEGTKGLYRSLGSIDVVAAARSVLQVERDQKDTDIRIVRQIKNSLAPSDGEIRFSITAEMGFQWLECKSTFVSSEQPKVPEFESKTEKAAYLIKKLLSDGDMRAREIYMRMKDEGISRRTAENTKKELGIRSYRKMRQWYWSIHTGE